MNIFSGKHAVALIATNSLLCCRNVFTVSIQQALFEGNQS